MVARHHDRVACDAFLRIASIAGSTICGKAEIDVCEDMRQVFQLDFGQMTNQIGRSLISESSGTELTAAVILGCAH